MSYAFHLQLEKINKQPLVCEGAGGPTRFFSAVRVHVMVHQGAKDPQSHTNVKHEDDRDAPASRPERHLTLPLKTPRGGLRRTIREPQPAFAHSSTMRRSAGASRCHTYFSRNGRGRRGRTNRSAICSARQGVGARLHCHRCGSRVPSVNAIWSFIESRNRPVVGRSAAPERPGRPGSGPTVQHGHWGSQIRFNDEAIRLSEARQAATRAARASKWLDLF